MADDVAKKNKKNAVNSNQHAKPPKKGSRHKARVRAVELAFEAEVKDISYPELIKQRSLAVSIDDTVPPVTRYAHRILELLHNNASEIDTIISHKLTNWTLDRLPAVDRAILRTGVAEMFFEPEVPPIIVVDEAVGIARELSTDNSPAFINGILDKLVADAKKRREM